MARRHLYSCVSVAGPPLPCMNATNSRRSMVLEPSPSAPLKTCRADCTTPVDCEIGWISMPLLESLLKQYQPPGSKDLRDQRQALLDLLLAQPAVAVPVELAERDMLTEDPQYMARRHLFSCVCCCGSSITWRNSAAQSAVLNNPAAATPCSVTTSASRAPRSSPRSPPGTRRGSGSGGGGFAAGSAAACSRREERERRARRARERRDEEREETKSRRERGEEQERVPGCGLCGTRNAVSI